ncbi:Not1 N-terminal domain, CCR4-Not complex component-domain-containing protein [Melampsora americana]|nr:Not1 N-terminal domain, CCR4-Not complex component-domain-containing protein [Melampsora americana]
MAQRKLQADIDRVLKLVQQGPILKTSIKKLQRQRDQIKTWLQSNDIKDKSSLMDHRKLIETQMERFKACEKEMKTKAFSKEGLSAQQKLDPKEVAKMEMSHWVSTMVDELGQQIERTEAEVELLRSQTKKKKATAADGRGPELEALNDRRRWHIGKLELIMRLLENGQISPERVGEVKDDIQYYVESNTEEDFTEDDDLYESLNLQEEEEQFGMHDDLLSSHDTSSIVEDATSTTVKLDLTGANRRPSGKGHTDDSGEKSPSKEKMPLSTGQLLRGPTVRKATLESGTVRPTILPGRTGVVTGMVVSSATAPRATPAALPPFASVASPEAQKSMPLMSSQDVSAQSTPSDSDHSPDIQDSNSNSQISHAGISSTSIALNPSGHSTQSAQSTQSVGGAASIQEVGRSPTNRVENSEQQQHRHMTSDHKHVSSLADLVETFESLKAHEPSMMEMHSILDSGLSSIPQIEDAEKPSYYAPRNPYQTSSHYPQQPMAFEKRPAIWSEIEVEVLFYLFYYHQGGYLQYLAAKELKKRAWRFHKYYLTWFQRAKNPEEMADDYEKGSYTYFDWEADWLMRTKTPFQFDYKHLEDSL